MEVTRDKREAKTIDRRLLLSFSQTGICHATLAGPQLGGKGAASIKTRPSPVPGLLQDEEVLDKQFRVDLVVSRLWASDDQGEGNIELIYELGKVVGWGCKLQFGSYMKSVLMKPNLRLERDHKNFPRLFL